MALYTFKVEAFHVDITRSRGDDTDHVTADLRVGHETLPTQSKSTGDVSSGDIPVGMVFGPILMSEPDTPTALSYSIYNGNITGLPVDLGVMTSGLVDKAVESLITPQNPEPADISDYTDYPEAPDDSDDVDFEDGSWIKVLEWVSLGKFLSFLFPDCDGFVAIGTIGKSKSRWDTAINAAGGSVFRQRIQYPGSDSPAGCGRNSSYAVTWSVVRETATGSAPHSLRQFLSDHHLSAQRGVRALSPGEQKISLKGLMF